MDDLELTARPAPTPQRPLIGTTVLLVEDSRFASEAIRLLALRSGARIRRADCISSAQRHLGTYRPGVAIVDLGLPDGSGLDLIAEMAGATHRPQVILGTSGQTRAEVEDACLSAGADGFLPKPIESLAAFQQLILRHMPSELWPKGLRAVNSETVVPDPIALAEDFAYAEKLLNDDGIAPGFVANFIEGLARTGHDDALLAEARTLTTATVDELRPRLQALIAARLGENRHVL